jgi:hypothetical protein
MHAILSSSRQVIYVHHIVLVSSICISPNGQTPNAILSTADIPERSEQPSMPENVAYPARMRYTLQWLVSPEALVCPNNRDATFRKRTKKLKPSPLLLHYNYGAAAVKQWGKGIETFQLRTTLLVHPCLPQPEAARKQLHITGIQPEIPVGLALATRGPELGLVGLGKRRTQSSHSGMRTM